MYDFYLSCYYFMNLYICEKFSLIYYKFGLVFIYLGKKWEVDNNNIGKIPFFSSCSRFFSLLS